MQVIIELVLGFLLITLTQVITLRLKPIRISPYIKATKSYNEDMTNSDYMIYNHRGKYIADRKLRKQ